MSVDWCMKLHLGLLVGITVSRGMSRGGCGVRKSLDSPSADEGAQSLDIYSSLLTLATCLFSLWPPP